MPTRERCFRQAPPPILAVRALCRLSQNNLLRLVIPVPERAVPDIHLGQTIAVKVSALNKSFPGKIVRFSDQIDTETRTMHTEVQVPNPKYELVPGMYATVQIPLHKAGNTPGGAGASRCNSWRGQSARCSS